MNKESGIKCGIFKIQEPQIEKATQLTNSTRGAIQKVQAAEKLLNEVSILLTCVEYDAQNLDCQACRAIANLRQKTAELIIKAGELAH